MQLFLRNEIEFLKGLQGSERREIVCGIVQLMFRDQFLFDNNTWLELLNALIFNLVASQKRGMQLQI